MSAVTFDTLKLVDALEKADIPRAQARAIVDVVREAQDAADVATKGDVALVRKDIDLMRKDMEMLRKDLIIKLGGMLMLGFGLVLAVLLK